MSAKGWMAVRSGGFSVRVGGRAVIAVLTLGVLAVAAVGAHVWYGEYPVPLLEVLRALLGMETGGDRYGFIVMELRLPRALVAFLVGVGFAVSGTLLQGITRNDLAAPDIVGVNAGAVFAAVTLIVMLPSVSVSFLPLAAFSGGFAAAGLLYLLAWRGSGSPVRLILIGVGLNVLAAQLTSLMIAIGDVQQVTQALIWLAGSVYGRTWEHAGALLPWLAVFLPLALLGFRQLNALALGEEVARGLGVRVEMWRGLLLLASVALAASSVAAAGIIYFVGLMAPHIARRIVGPSHGGVILVSAMVGGLLVVTADLAGRVIFSPVEIPAGIITSVIGAPYFIYLLRRSRDA